MLVKFISPHDDGEFLVNPAFVQSVHPACESVATGETWAFDETAKRIAFHVAGVCWISTGGEESGYKVYGTLDEVAAKLNGEKGGG